MITNVWPKLDRTVLWTQKGQSNRQCLVVGWLVGRSERKQTYLGGGDRGVVADVVGWGRRWGQ